MKRFIAAAVCATGALALTAGQASAGIAGQEFGFVGVSNNDAFNTSVGEAQFRLVVGDVGSQALFSFHNDGPIASVMSELYWDDDAGVLDSMVSINGSGVSYEPVGSGVSPGNLPAGNTIGFTADFATEPNNPQPQNGVNPGDSVSVLFNINGSIQDVIDAIAAGELRIGVHAQAIGQNGNSESFVTGGDATPIPTPGAAALGLVMLLGVGTRRRR